MTMTPTQLVRRASRARHHARHSIVLRRVVLPRAAGCARAAAPVRDACGTLAWHRRGAQPSKRATCLANAAPQWTGTGMVAATTPPPLVLTRCAPPHSTARTSPSSFVVALPAFHGGASRRGKSRLGSSRRRAGIGPAASEPWVASGPRRPLVMSRCNVSAEDRAQGTEADSCDPRAGEAKGSASPAPCTHYAAPTL